MVWSSCQTIMPLSSQFVKNAACGVIALAQLENNFVMCIDKDFGKIGTKKVNTFFVSKDYCAVSKEQS